MTLKFGKGIRFVLKCHSVGSQRLLWCPPTLGSSPVEDHFHHCQPGRKNFACEVGYLNERPKEGYSSWYRRGFLHFSAAQLLALLQGDKIESHYSSIFCSLVDLKYYVHIKTTRIFHHPVRLEQAPAVPVCFWIANYRLYGFNYKHIPFHAWGHLVAIIWDVFKETDGRVGIIMGRAKPISGETLVIKSP